MVSLISGVPTSAAPWLVLQISDIHLRQYPILIDLLGAERVGFRNGCKQTAGKELVGVLADVLFEVLPAERRKRLVDHGLHFPGLFQPLTTSVYNDPSKHRHGRLPQLIRADLSRMVEKLLRVRGLPTLQSASWGNVSAAITALATCLDKNGKYFETMTQRVNLMHQRMEPARLSKTGESDAVVGKEGCIRELAPVARYKSLEQVLAASEPYQKAFFVNDVAPADRQQRDRYAMSMRCNCLSPLNCITSTGEATWARCGGSGEHAKILQTLAKMPP